MNLYMSTSETPQEPILFTSKHKPPDFVQKNPYTRWYYIAPIKSKRYSKKDPGAYIETPFGALFLQSRDTSISYRDPKSTYAYIEVPITLFSSGPHQRIWVMDTPSHLRTLKAAQESVNWFEKHVMWGLTVYRHKIIDNLNDRSTVVFGASRAINAKRVVTEHPYITVVYETKSNDKVSQYAFAFYI